MMDNVFQNAKFGDKFKTRDGRIVIYWYYDAKDPYQMPHWVCFGDGSFTHYADDGIYHKGNPNTVGDDIVGRWEDLKIEEK